MPIFTDIKKFLEAKKDPIIEERFRNYDFKMIAVGRFVDKEKNFSMLIEMMKNFIKICPKAILVIVGDGPDREKYKIQITNHKLKNHVIIEAWRDDLESFYKSFDLFLLSSNYEGWGRTAIEATASGLPIVMTDVGVAGEFIKDGKNGSIVPVSDKDRFLRSCRDLYLDSEKIKSFISAGYESLKNLRIKSQQEYLKEYEKSIKLCLRS